MKTYSDRFNPDLIQVPERIRSGLHEETVARLKESISKLGLMTPISVRTSDGEDDEQNIILVAGMHRLEACRRLGWDFIDCIVLKGTETDVRLWEIAENLDRADLTVQERSDHITEWVRLTETKLQLGQNAPIVKKRLDGRGHRQESGVRAAVRDLGIERTEARRAIKIASIPQPARAAADAAGLNTQTARLEIARAPDPMAKVRDLVERRSRPAPAIKNADESEEDWRRALFSVWNRGAQDWRERALAAMGTPLFENARSSAARH